MRYLTGVIVGVAMFGMAQQAGAAGVGLPSGSTEKRFEAMVEYSRMFDRDLEADAGSTDEISLSNQAHARLSYALFDWLQPYVKLGVSEFAEDLDNVNIVGLGRRNINMEYDWAFSWGGGLSGIYRLENGWFVGYAGEYLTSSNELDSASESGEKATRVAGEGDFSEWHGAGFFGYTFDLGAQGDRSSKLSLYAGGRYSEFKIKNDGLQYDVSTGTTLITGETDGDDNAGVFLGAAWQLGDNWKVAAEGRFIDETAVTGQVTFKF